MSTTNLETHTLQLSIRAFIAIIIFIVGVVSSFFYGANKLNAQLEETNRKIEQTNNLLIQNHLKDSLDRNLIQLELSILKREINKN